MENTDPVQKTNPVPVTVVSHTHWDRAWYVTFQEFRIRLVRLVDRLLNLLTTDPDYRVFMLDGQMAVLEDYLEVRPHRQGELERLCRTGRIKVGPWYVLADEFLVSPESLIRNLQLGHRMGNSYGGVSKIGYVPDGFGHVAQLPQILRGFGIDNAFFWRGLGAEGERLGTEFTWYAPDRSSVTTIWMPFGYHIISNLGFAIHWGDTSQMEFDAELAVNQIRQAINKLQPMTNTNALLLMNGIDHEEPEPRVPKILDQVNDLLESYDFTHGTLDEHLAHVRASGVNLPEFTGEFRWGRYSEILQAVYATRIHLKQSNHKVENLLERFSEPLTVLAHWAGVEVPEGTQDLMWTAWRWLLKNHPHDDIYGSGIDAVHDEMDFRFAQAEQIGSALVRDSVRLLARQVDFTCQPGIPVLVFNPLGWERNETVVGEIDFNFDDVLVNNFKLVDSSGRDVKVQVLYQEDVFWMETLKANRKRRVHVAFNARVPACGYSAYFVQPGSNQLPGIAEDFQAEEDTWKISLHGAENQYLSFSIAPDGSLDMYDKGTGVNYPGLAYFEDCEDTGDEYSFCPFPESKPISTRGRSVQIHQLVTGPNQVTFEVRHRFEIPESLAEDRKRRSDVKVEIPITSQITLYRHKAGIYIETEIENLAQDHKLSVVFPTDMKPEYVHVDQPFMVIPRHIDLPDSIGWVEDPTPLMHQRAFTDLSQDGRGLAVFNQGLPAIEVTRNSQGVQMSIVLLRCVGWLSRDGLWNRRVAAGPIVPTPGAQCLRRYKFQYGIFPHADDWRNAYPAAYNYVAPLYMTRADTHEGLDLREMNITRDNPNQVKERQWSRGGHLPPETSFLSIDKPALVLSSLHQAMDRSSMIVRFYNIDSDPISAHLTSNRAIAEAWLTNLNEERHALLRLQDAHTVLLEAGPHQVITVELCPESP